jgi:hypothetical protein
VAYGFQFSGDPLRLRIPSCSEKRRRPSERTSQTMAVVCVTVSVTIASEQDAQDATGRGWIRERYLA